MMIKNEHQCEEFKMRDGEQWSILEAAGNSDQVRLNNLPMCAHWHTHSSCFKNNKASHVRCLEITGDMKAAHLKWMKKAWQEE